MFAPCTLTPMPTATPEYGSGTILGGYIEGLAFSVNALANFGGGREIVYNFSTFERAAFSYTFDGYTTSALSGTGQAYVGHVEGFETANDNFDTFIQQYTGLSTFVAGEFSLELPKIGGVATGVSHFYSPSGLYGNTIYLAGTLGGISSVGLGVAIGNANYIFESGHEQSYIENCQVNTSRLTYDILTGAGSSHLQGDLSAALPYRWLAAGLANIAAWRYNSLKSRC
jgi:hypothetical protein